MKEEGSTLPIPATYERVAAFFQGKSGTFL